MNRAGLVLVVAALGTGLALGARPSSSSRVAWAQQEAPAPKPAEPVRVEMKDAKGRAVGSVTLEDTPHGLLVQADLRNLPRGAHGFHIHQIGKCEPPFESAGGHLGSEAHRHGFREPSGPHAGDLPNIHVPKSGELRVDLFAPGLSLEGDEESVLDGDGATILIHAEPDDYRSDPAGKAGARIACGVILAAPTAP